mmetsp:Transcript_53233/g.79521  ORF Transcript_53233/g.79521 Transcript_53233/m.79521 type:complete len:845 (+) Transcript_53233:97-2631(+)
MATAQAAVGNAPSEQNDSGSTPSPAEMDVTSAGAPISAIPGDYPLTDIEKPHAHDVLCGRGGGTNNHIGNNHWRTLVNANKRLYISLPKRQKMLVAQSIVRAVRCQVPPGRFLQKDAGSNTWCDIGDQKAQDKTSQALREGAPDLRNSMKEEQKFVESQGFATGMAGPMATPMAAPMAPMGAHMPYMPNPYAAPMGAIPGMPQHPGMMAMPGMPQPPPPMAASPVMAGSPLMYGSPQHQMQVAQAAVMYNHAAMQTAMMYQPGPFAMMPPPHPHAHNAFYPNGAPPIPPQKPTVQSSSAATKTDSTDPKTPDDKTAQAASTLAAPEPASSADPPEEASPASAAAATTSGPNTVVLKSDGDAAPPDALDSDSAAASEHMPPPPPLPPHVKPASVMRLTPFETPAPAMPSAHQANGSSSSNRAAMPSPLPAQQSDSTAPIQPSIPQTKTEQETFVPSLDQPCDKPISEKSQQQPSQKLPLAAQDPCAPPPLALNNHKHPQQQKQQLQQHQSLQDTSSPTSPEANYKKRGPRSHICFFDDQPRAEETSEFQRMMNHHSNVEDYFAPTPFSILQHAGLRMTNESNLIDSDDEDDVTPPVDNPNARENDRQKWESLKALLEMHNCPPHNQTEVNVPPTSLNRDASANMSDIFSADDISLTSMTISRNVSRTLVGMGRDSTSTGGSQTSGYIETNPTNFERATSLAFSDMSLSRGVSLSGPGDNAVTPNPYTKWGEVTFAPGVAGGGFFQQQQQQQHEQQQQQPLQYQLQAQMETNRTTTDSNYQTSDGSDNNISEVRSNMPAISPQQQNQQQGINNANVTSSERESLEMIYLSRGASLAFEKFGNDTSS